MALSVEENELITHVGPGTPCGEMMRRYWHPIGLSAELKNRPIRRRLSTTLDRRVGCSTRGGSRSSQPQYRTRLRHLRLTADVRI